MFAQHQGHVVPSGLLSWPQNGRASTICWVQDLLAEQGPAYDINLSVFYDLQHTITGWPGGRVGRRRGSCVCPAGWWSQSRTGLSGR